MSFQFSLIRFVPDPARGEFVNIGAVAGSDEAHEWELRLVSNLSRAKALDDRGVLSKAFAYAAGLEDHIAALDVLPETGDAEPISSDLLRRRATEMHNIIQFSAPAPADRGQRRRRARAGLRSARIGCGSQELSLREETPRPRRGSSRLPRT